ncbi:MAG: hypothetical protein ABI462_06095 [Ignavibacteria bacterium]
MKKLLSHFFVIAAVCLFSSALYSQTMTIETYNKPEPPKGEYDNRTPVKSYEITGGAEPVVYMNYEVADNGAWETHPLILQITKDDGTIAYSYPFDPGGASGINYATSTPLSEGNYTAMIVEAGDAGSVWCKKDFTVGAAMTKVGGSSNVIFCDYVDDNWNPIGAVTRIKAGQCLNFMVEFPSAMDISAVGWEIYKMKKDGTDGEFISEFTMTMGSHENIKHFATTEKLCKFETKGKYRVYAIDWYKRHVNSTIGNFTEYYAKGEIIVE